MLTCPSIGFRNAGSSSGSVRSNSMSSVAATGSQCSVPVSQVGVSSPRSVRSPWCRSPLPVRSPSHLLSRAAPRPFRSAFWAESLPSGASGCPGDGFAFFGFRPRLHAGYCPPAMLSSSSRLRSIGRLAVAPEDLGRVGLLSQRSRRSRSLRAAARRASPWSRPSTLAVALAVLLLVGGARRWAGT